MNPRKFPSHCSAPSLETFGEHSPARGQRHVLYLYVISKSAASEKVRMIHDTVQVQYDSDFVNNGTERMKQYMYIEGICVASNNITYKKEKKNWGRMSLACRLLPFQTGVSL
jgi:hypothetical protein